MESLNTLHVHVCTWYINSVTFCMTILMPINSPCKPYILLLTNIYYKECFVSPSDKQLCRFLKNVSVAEKL